MRETTIRNSTARWASWLVIGVVLTVIWFIVAASWVEDCRGVRSACTPVGFGTAFAIGGMFIGPFCVGFLLAALVSFRARVRLTAEGVYERHLFGERLYPWMSIQNIRMHTVKEYTNGIRFGTRRTVELEVNGKLHELPVPRAGTWRNRAEYERQAQLIFELWRSQVTEPRPTHPAR